MDYLMKSCLKDREFPPKIPPFFVITVNAFRCLKMQTSDKVSSWRAFLFFGNILRKDTMPEFFPVISFGHRFNGL